MQTSERHLETPSREPSGRRRWLIPALAGAAAIILAIVVGALLLIGGGDEPDVIEPTPTTTSTTVPEAAVMTPLQVIEALDAAIVSGDWEAARALYSPDATYTQIDDGFGFDFLRHGRNCCGVFDLARLDGRGSASTPWYSNIYDAFDWDGDGLESHFDDMATVHMGDHALGVTRYYACTQADETTAVCDIVIEGHAFIDEPPPVTDTFLVIDGVITDQTFDTTMSRLEDPFAARLSYLGFLEDNYADQVDELFNAEQLGQLIMTPETVEIHRQLIAEWRAQS